MACKHKKRLWENGWCNVACRYCTFTQENSCEYNKQTNADRIRAMSDEELAEFMAAKFADLQSQQLFGESYTPTATQLSALAHTWYCQWMYWLRQPVKEVSVE